MPVASLPHIDETINIPLMFSSTFVVAFVVCNLMRLACIQL